MKGNKVFSVSVTLYLCALTTVVLSILSDSAPLTANSPGHRIEHRSMVEATATPQYPPANRASLKNSAGLYTELPAYRETDLAAWPLINLTIAQETGPQIVVYHSFQTSGFQLSQQLPALDLGLGDYGQSCPVVTQLDPNSSTAKAGLQINDKILALNDWIFSCSEVEQFLNNFAIGDAVDVVVQRGDAIHTISARLAPYRSVNVPLIEESKFVLDDNQPMYLYALTPSQTLVPGGIYCLAMANVSIGDNEEPRWCFAIQPTPVGYVSYNDQVEHEIQHWLGDSWRFAGQAGDFVSIQVEGTDLGNLEIILYDANLQELVRQQGYSSAQINNAKLVADGEYTVLIRTSDDRKGTYTFRIGKSLDDGILAYGDSKTITQTGLAGNHWRFFGSAGDIITIVAVTGTTSLQLDLRDEGNQILVAGSNAIRHYRLPVAGAFVVTTMAHTNEATGNYDIEFSKLDAMAESPTGEIGYDLTYEKELASIAGDRWNFPCKQDEFVTIVTSSAEAINLVLYDVKSERLAEADVFPNGKLSRSELALVKIPQTGDCTVVAYSPSSHSGKYTLSLSKLSKLSENPKGKLHTGERLRTQLTQTGGDRWQFHVQKGEFLNFFVDDILADIALSIIDKENKFLVTEQRAIRYFAAPEAGDYTVLIQEKSRERRPEFYQPSYVLSFTKLSAITEQARGSLTYGQYVQDIIYNQAAGAIWAFHGKAGEAIALVIDNPNSYVELYAPDGALLNETRDRVIAETLPITGDYAVVVHTAGLYGILLDSQENFSDDFRGLLTPNAQVNRQLDGNAQNLWYFWGRQGDIVTITVNSAVIETELILTEPGAKEGNAVTGSLDTVASINQQLLLETGLHKIVIKNRTSYSGDYTLQLSSGSADRIGKGMMTLGKAISTKVESSAGHEWRFKGDDGDGVRIAIESQEFTPEIALQDAADQLITPNQVEKSDNTLAAIYQLPSRGEYSLVVYGYLGNSGRYTLTVDNIKDTTTERLDDVDESATRLGKLQQLEDHFGLTFIQIPAGSFLMGSKTAEIEEAVESFCEQPSEVCREKEFLEFLKTIETPQHEVVLDEYWISKTPITFDQYYQFVKAGGYQQREFWSETGWQWKESEQLTQAAFFQQLRDIPMTFQPDFPVIVSWHEALAFSRWLAKETGLPVRLPTEAQWEKAARGTQGAPWPWGEEEPGAEQANQCDMNCPDPLRIGVVSAFDDGYTNLAPVDAYPAGASPYGVLDMAGNLLEWTSTRFGACNGPRPEPQFTYPYSADDGREEVETADQQECRIARGGYFMFPTFFNRPSFRFPVAPDQSRELLTGIRLVVLTKE